MENHRDNLPPDESGDVTSGECIVDDCELFPTRHLSNDKRFFALLNDSLRLLFRIVADAMLRSLSSSPSDDVSLLTVLSSDQQLSSDLFVRIDELRSSL